MIRIGKWRSHKESDLKYRFIHQSIRVSDLTPEQVQAFRIADNKMAEFDLNLNLNDIALELKEMANHDFNLELTGFVCSEIDSLSGDLLFESGNTDPDARPDIEEGGNHGCQGDPSVGCEERTSSEADT